MTENYKEKLEYLANIIAKTANRDEPTSLVTAKEYQAQCPDPFHGIQGPVRNTYADAKVDATAHDDDSHKSRTFCVVISIP
jgi:hypothetical protein